MILASSLQGWHRQLQLSVPYHIVAWKWMHFLNWMNVYIQSFFKGLASFFNFNSKPECSLLSVIMWAAKSKHIYFKGMWSCLCLLSLSSWMSPSQVDVLKAKEIQWNERLKYRIQIESLPKHPTPPPRLFSSLEIFHQSTPD